MQTTDSAHGAPCRITPIAGRRAVYRSVLAADEITERMSRQGNCWDNAVAKSFFSTLEHELPAGPGFHSRHEAQRAIFEIIGV